MGGKTQTTTQKNTPPKFIQTAQQNVLQGVGQVVQKPLQQYTGQTVAPLNSMQTGAINQIQGIGQQYFPEAQRLAGIGSGPLDQSKIQGYMNPYQQNVIDAYLQNQLRSDAIAQQGVVGNSIMRGSYGGDRAGIGQAELERSQKLARDQTVAGLLAQGYDQASALAQADRQAALSGSQLYAGLAGLETNQAKATLNAGTMQQTQSQNELNDLYKRFTEARDYDKSMVEWASAITGQTAAGAGGTATMTQPGPSVMSQIIGAATTVLPFLQTGGRVPTTGYAFGGAPGSPASMTWLQRLREKMRARLARPVGDEVVQEGGLSDKRSQALQKGLDMLGGGEEEKGPPQWILTPGQMNVGGMASGGVPQRRGAAGIFDRNAGFLSTPVSGIGAAAANNGHWWNNAGAETGGEHTGAFGPLSNGLTAMWDALGKDYSSGPLAAVLGIFDKLGAKLGGGESGGGGGGGGSTPGNNGHWWKDTGRKFARGGIAGYAGGGGIDEKPLTGPPRGTFFRDYTTITDQTSPEGMTPEAKRIMRAMEEEAMRLGLTEFHITGANGPGHQSHDDGTEWDLLGVGPGGREWNPSEKALLLEAARRAGATRFGIYGDDEHSIADGELHVGYRPDFDQNVVWNDQTRGQPGIGTFPPEYGGFVTRVRNGQAPLSSDGRPPMMSAYADPSMLPPPKGLSAIETTLEGGGAMATPMPPPSRDDIRRLTSGTGPGDFKPLFGGMNEIFADERFRTGAPPPPKEAPFMTMPGLESPPPGIATQGIGALMPPLDPPKTVTPRPVHDVDTGIGPPLDIRPPAAGGPSTDTGKGPPPRRSYWDRFKEDEWRLPMVIAGLNMLAGDSPNAMANIGRGGLAGLEFYQGRQDSRAAAEQQRLENKREDQRLALEEQKVAGNLAEYNAPTLVEVAIPEGQEGAGMRIKGYMVAPGTNPNEAPWHPGFVPVGGPYTPGPLVDMRGPNAYSTEGAGAIVENFKGIQAQGQSARQRMGDLRTLGTLAGQINTGKWTQLQTVFGPWLEAMGVEVEGLGETQAWEALVSRIAPTLRVPGSGATSDFEMQRFLMSLPALVNDPEGNKIIQDTMEAIAQYQVQAGEIATGALLYSLGEDTPGAISPDQAYKQLAELGDPLTLWKTAHPEFLTSTAIERAAPAVGEVVDFPDGTRGRFTNAKGNNDYYDPANWEAVGG